MVGTKIQHGAHIIEQTGKECFIVATLPRRGSNEFGFRYLDSAKQYADTAAARERKNRARREKNEVMRSLGLKRVRGALGGVYWE